MKQLGIIDKLAQYEKSHSHIAYAYVLIGHLLMVIMWSMFKSMMNQHFDYNQILYVRGLIIFAFNYYLLRKYNLPFYPESSSAQQTLLARSVIQMISPLLQFYGISQLQISDATVLSLTSPIWVQIFSRIIYKEKLQSKNLIFTFISFGGILFICRPAFIFGEILESDKSLEEKDKNHFLGCICMLIGSMALAVSQSLFKGLAGKTSNFVAIQYFYFTNLVSTPVMMIYKETNDMLIFESSNYIVIILVITVVAYAGQVVLTRGFILESPSKLSQFAYTRIIYSFAIDIFIFSQKISMLSIIGVTLIIYSSYNIIKNR